MKIIFYLFIISLILPTLTFAYIPSSKMILDRTAENAGSGSYTIDSEVQFQNGLEPLVLRESWVIDNERGLRLTVSGTKEFKDSIKMQFVYLGDHKYFVKAGSTVKESKVIPEDFEERIFHLHSAEEIAAKLVGWNIAPVNFLNKKNITKNGNEFKYEPESWVRLGRTGGVVTYAFGQATPENQTEANSGMWIEQDQFLIRKVRLPSQAEISAENYSTFAKGLSYPKNRTISWGQNQVSVRVLSISAKETKWAKQKTNPNTLDVTTKLDGLTLQPAKALVEEFYSRFR